MNEHFKIRRFVVMRCNAPAALRPKHVSDYTYFVSTSYYYVYYFTQKVKTNIVRLRQ